MTSAPFDEDAPVDVPEGPDRHDVPGEDANIDEGAGND